MKPFKILIIFFLSAFSLCKAQTYSVAPGTEFTPPDLSKWAGYAGENSSSFFVFRIRTKGIGNHYYVEGFSKSTRQKSFETELELQEEADMILNVNDIDLRTIVTEEKIFIFFKGFDKKAKENKYFMKTLMANGKPGDMKLFTTGPEKLDVYFYQSKDKTLIMALHSKPWEDGHQRDEAELYDVNMNKLATKKLPDEYKDHPIQTYNYSLDNNGNISFMMSYLVSQEPKVFGLGVGTIPVKSDKAKMVTLASEDLDINNARVLASEDGHFILTGLYKHIEEKDMALWKKMNHKEHVAYEKELEAKKEVGIFSFLVDLNTMAVVKSKTPFPAEVTAKMDYAQGLLSKGAVNKYYVASALIENGGEYYLVENHKYTITSDNSSSTYEREFIISKINKAGSISWIKIFPKNTVNSLNTFNTLVNNGKVYLFYLEHPKNLKMGLKDYEPLKYDDIRSYNGSVVVAQELSPDGEATRKQLFENKGWCYDPQPFNILLEKDNSLLLRMIKHKDERFDVMKIN
jgi:hypothetical protein